MNPVSRSIAFQEDDLFFSVRPTLRRVADYFEVGCN